MSSVVLSDVSFGYQTEQVLEDISLTCERGQIVGLVGSSGIGKSTLLHLISGSVEPTRGKVSVLGETATEAAQAHAIGFVFQQPTLLPWLCAWENVALPLRLHFAKRRLSETALAAALEEKVWAALRQARIEHAAAKVPAELSGGMQTRVALARALVYQPSVLLLDEPFGALDDTVREELYVYLQAVLQDTQAAMVLVTHNLMEAVLLCDVVHILRRRQADRPARLTDSVPIDLPRPRTMQLVTHQSFARAWERLREVQR